jgi:hypothetical protein
MRANGPRGDRRQRIIHVWYAHPDDLARAGRMGSSPTSSRGRSSSARRRGRARSAPSAQVGAAPTAR